MLGVSWLVVALLVGLLGAQRSPGVPAKGRLLSRLVGSRRQTTPPPEQEREMLDNAFNSDPEGVAALLRGKLEVWRELKAEGQLQRLGGDELDEAVLEDIDRAAAAKELRWRLRDAEKVVRPASGAPSDRERELAALRTKLAGLPRSSAVATYALFNEAKDKGILDGNLVESCLTLLAKSGVGGTAIAAFRQYANWVAEGTLVGNDPSFPLRFVYTCASSGMAEAAREASSLVLECGWATAGDLRAAELCSAILAARSPVEMKESVTSLTSSLPAMSIGGVNICVRALGKTRQGRRLFALMDAVRAADLSPDDETVEFLANAFIASVRETCRARAMRDLPAGNASVAEVVFVGRSNVGKSSLVNFLVNRKALASTSATPGHTKSFHFFAVNEGRADLPGLTLVDVPGLGFAEADEGTQDSWRSLLERYASVRDSLGAVFHLVDSRHGLTPTDRQLIDILARAADSRRSSQRSPFRYVVVLTKVDKASKKQIASTTSEVIEGAMLLGGEDRLQVLQSSAVSGRGREELLRALFGEMPQE